MYRFFTALFVLACISYSTAALAGGASGVCIAKDQVIAHEAADGVNFRKVEGADADALTRLLKPKNVPTGKSYIVFWMNGAEFSKAKIVTFDEHNCADRVVIGPRDRILEVIGGAGA